MAKVLQQENSSFRDRTGFVFYLEGSVYRAISKKHLDDYEFLLSSKLYEHLIDKKFLVEHSAVESNHFSEYDLQDYKILKAQKIPFISYPYEWCFSQLKAAALLTLKIQKQALNHGMSLKDASAYNVQFIGCKPVFIDILSFEKYVEGKPWIAYKQFCQHFLAPLAILAYRNSNLSKLSQLYIDGIPLDVASSVLPMKSYLNSVIAVHLHYHSKIQTSQGKKHNSKNISNILLSKKKLLGIIEHLEDGIKNLHLHNQKSHWDNYYQDFSYSDKAFQQKKEIIDKWLQKVKPSVVWDLGANTGVFSELSSEVSDYTVAFDSDFSSIEKFFTKIKKDKSQSAETVLPLVFDIANPSPAIGWANEERKKITERGRADLVFALALIHHLAIGNNVPFDKIANFMKQCGSWLIIEFVPKDDSQVQRLLSSREDVFDDYNKENFLNSFGKYFEIADTACITESERVMYLMKIK